MTKDLVPVTLDIDITKPRWDQRTFLGRLRHFAAITDPRLTLVGVKQLEEEKCIVEDFKKGEAVSAQTIQIIGGVLQFDVTICPTPLVVSYLTHVIAYIF